MKRLICILVLLLVLTPTVLAESPAAAPQPLEAARSALFVSFPGIKAAIVEPYPDPHAYRALRVAGEDWEFTLVERRWGWEIDTAYIDSASAQVLMLASLDYLSGDAWALRIFADPDPEYQHLLEDLTPGQGNSRTGRLILRPKPAFAGR